MLTHKIKLFLKFIFNISLNFIIYKKRFIFLLIINFSYQLN